MKKRPTDLNRASTIATYLGIPSSSYAALAAPRSSRVFSRSPDASRSKSIRPYQRLTSGCSRRWESFSACDSAVSEARLRFVPAFSGHRADSHALFDERRAWSQQHHRTAFDELLCERIERRRLVALAEMRQGLDGHRRQQQRAARVLLSELGEAITGTLEDGHGFRVLEVGAGEELQAVIRSVPNGSPEPRSGSALSNSCFASSARPRKTCANALEPRFHGLQGQSAASAKSTERCMKAS